MYFLILEASCFSVPIELPGVCVLNYLISYLIWIKFVLQSQAIRYIFIITTIIMLFMWLLITYYSFQYNLYLNLGIYYELTTNLFGTFSLKFIIFRALNKLFVLEFLFQTHQAPSFEPVIHNSMELLLSYKLRVLSLLG